MISRFDRLEQQVRDLERRREIERLASEHGLDVDELLAETERIEDFQRRGIDGRALVELLAGEIGEDPDHFEREVLELQRQDKAGEP